MASIFDKKIETCENRQLNNTINNQSKRQLFIWEPGRNIHRDVNLTEKIILQFLAKFAFIIIIAPMLPSSKLEIINYKTEIKFVQITA